MLYETSQPQVTPESLCPVPVLSFFTQSSSLVSSKACNTKRGAGAQPFRCTVNRSC